MGIVNTIPRERICEIVSLVPAYSKSLAMMDKAG